MTALSEDVITKVSGEAAENHVEKYYAALQNSRSSISSFYAPTTAGIVYNGNVLDDGAAFQDMFEKRMPPTVYDVQAFDCHVVNPNFVPEGETGFDAEKGKNMTVVVLVSGIVKIGEPAKVRQFSETFVLVPDYDAAKAKRKGKASKGWLIQSQTFRFVV